jgi:hypothetical protein
LYTKLIGYLLVDYSDLEEKLIWAKQNDDKAKKIMENAKELMTSFSRRDHFECYLYLLLSTYQKLWKDKNTDH